MPLREEFPEAGSDYMGGTSDGYEYQTIFAGSRLPASYDMVRQFLKEEGYGDLPIPKDAEVPPGVDNCRAKMDKAIEKSDLPELAAVEACVIELKQAILGA